MSSLCNCETVVVSEPPPETIVSQPPQPSTVVISPAEQGPTGPGVPGPKGDQGDQGIPGVALVQSVFGRVDVVVAAADDYTIAQITGLTVAGDGTKFLADDGTYKATSGGVTAFNGRTGAITPLANDYALAQITGLLDGGTGANVLTDDGTYDPTASSFNGRTGGIIPTANDYGIAMIAGMTVAGDGTQPLMNDGLYRPIVEAHVTDLDRINWAGDWAAGTYNLNQCVNDSRWLMIANKTTTDRAAPQAVGQPAWVSGLGDTPTWNSDQDAAADQIITGQRYTIAQGLFTSAYRLWVPTSVNPNVTYELIITVDPLGSPISEVLISERVLTTSGWLTVQTGSTIVPPGVTFDLWLVIRSHAGLATWNANYNYVRSNTAPIAGEITHANNGAILNVSYTDDDAGDQTTNVQALSLGEQITAGGITWTIDAITQAASYAICTVTPETRAAAAVYDVTFTTFTAQAIDSVSITDHFLADAQVRGFKSVTDYASIVLDDDAYGVDFEYSAAAISPDWDVMLYGG